MGDTRSGGSGDAKYRTLASNLAPRWIGGIGGRGQSEEDILAEMELNPKMIHHSVLEVIAKSARIAFQTSVCFIFGIIYHSMQKEFVSPWYVLEGCWGTTVLGHVVYQVVKNYPVENVSKLLKILLPREQIRVSLFYLFSSYVLAPVLRTLTLTISSDTIHAVSVALLFVHLLTNDYGVSGFLVSKTISINAAIIAAICLSSRLPTDSHAIALTTLAVQSFVLFPIFSPLLWDSAVLLALITAVTGVACFYISVQIFLVYVAVTACITVLLPLSFVTSQSFKYNLYGPWDEAVVGQDE